MARGTPGGRRLMELATGGFIMAAIAGGCGRQNTEDTTPLAMAPARGDDPALAEVDALFRDYDRPGVPGAAVMVVKDGELVHGRAYGLANLETDAVAGGATSYRLASVTKQFIGMAVAILAERGRLRYDQTLLDFFPDYPGYGRRITVEQLLHHTSGLKDYENLIPSGQTRQLTDRDVLAIYERTTGGDFSPGTRYRYCNGGYVLLGLIVEAASGQRLADFLREAVFTPLGMRSEMYEGETTPIANRAYGYSLRGGRWTRTDQSVTSATRGDGGIYASVRDLHLWDRGLAAGALVSPATMTRIFTSGTLNNGSATGYGFGWQIGSYRGERRYSHTGSTIGFRTVLHRYPDRAFSVAVLINRDGSTPWDLANAVADRVLFGTRDEAATDVAQAAAN